GHRRSGTAAEDQAVDDHDRRHGGKAANPRHRRSPEEGAARGAALSPSLRRGLVARRALDRVSPENARQHRQAAFGRQIHPDDHLLRQGHGARPENVLVPLALYRGRHHGRGDERAVAAGTGMYGHPMPKQDGAPLRLVLPWKYGFKSIKSIVKFSFVDKRPV